MTRSNPDREKTIVYCHSFFFCLRVLNEHIFIWPFYFRALFVFCSPYFWKYTKRWKQSLRICIFYYNTLFSPFVPKEEWIFYFSFEHGKAYACWLSVDVRSLRFTPLRISLLLCLLLFGCTHSLLIFSTDFFFCSHPFAHDPFQLGFSLNFFFKF